MNEFYVYIKFRPWNGSPCYVGKGKAGRAYVHEYKSSNPHLANIIAKAGGELPTVFIKSNMTEAEAFELEILLIRSIGRSKNGGPLCNLTDGGEGFTGGRHTARVREVIGARTRGKKQSPEHSAKISFANKGKIKGPMPIETRKRLSEAHKNSIAVKENIIRLADLSRGKPKTEQHRKNAAAGKVGKRASIQGRANMSAAQKKRFINSLDKTKPWVAEGISRRTWYRRRGI